MSAAPRHADVIGAFYAAHRLAGRDSPPAGTSLYRFTSSLAQTSTQGDTE